MIFETGDRWPYNVLFCGMFLQDLFNTARSILVQLPPSFFSTYALSASMWRIHIVVLTWTLHFILSDRSDFHMTKNLSIATHAFASRVLMSFLVDKTLLLRWMNLSTSFTDQQFCAEKWPLWLKHVTTVCVHMEAYTACCPFLTIPQGRYICQKCHIISEVHVRDSLFLAFSIVKPFSFIKSIDFQSTLSM